VNARFGCTCNMLECCAVRACPYRCLCKLNRVEHCMTREHVVTVGPAHVHFCCKLAVAASCGGSRSMSGQPTFSVCSSCYACYRVVGMQLLSQTCSGSVCRAANSSGADNFGQVVGWYIDHCSQWHWHSPYAACFPAHACAAAGG
jgi:hypothetical protein